MADTPATISFKDTLNLPRTDFPIRANTKEEDPAMLARWEKENLFSASFMQNAGKKKFILHDGPPYANGNIHIGHAYNKILKDMVTKSQRMLGKHVPVTPGWDCHGLPIELKVTKENPEIDRVGLKKACRVYAQKWIDVQRAEFKKLGVLMDWDRPYLTMAHEYESFIIKAFGDFVKQGYIERKNKTVPWCSSCETVLASAEIEYEDRKDPSVYVFFKLEQQVTDAVFPNLMGKPVNILIWTTTPWTLPLNRAIMLKPGASYVVMDVNGTLIAVGKERAKAIAALVEAEPNIVAEFTADDLIRKQARAYHPFIQDFTVPLVPHEAVAIDDGTAFVHCAPGCGPEDYEVGVKNNLEIFSPVSTSGKYTAGIEPKELLGMSVQDGQFWVIKKLAELGNLFHKSSIKHSYPHCWRCHNGLIFRATKQWFCDLAQGNLKKRALEATETIKTIPEKSIHRLQATIDGRLEWCLSRQRIWGVPIPAILCEGCDYTYTSPELINAVAEKVATQGIEYWDAVPVEELIPKGFTCPTCKVANFKKETDILDVWFDSGISHYAVLKHNPNLAFPADIYLEGKDQHRGWFQSSLLTSLVIEDTACMKTIVTHGFTVDEKGRKMSKSLGNVVSPQQMIDTMGTDGLRLWASSIDISGEAVVSDVLIKNVQEVFRKVRNTCRFLVSNLYDFDIEKDAVPFDQLLPIDQYALEELSERNLQMIKCYNEYDFTAIFHSLGDYSAVELSSFYLDIIKDRLYVEQADGKLRRSAQTACWYILDTMTRLMAPILSFTAEQLSDHYQKNKTSSIHLQEFATLGSIWDALANKYAQNYPFNASNRGFDDSLRMAIEDFKFRGDKINSWEALESMRSAVLKGLEGLREQAIIKHSLEASVTLYIAPELQEQLAMFDKELKQSGQLMADFFKEFFIVSDVKFATEQNSLVATGCKGLFIHVERAAGEKCPRCWRWEVTQDPDHLCARCQGVPSIRTYRATQDER
jgi:isoleucyl-tRNA synthetase